jgi:hypothetical protein
LEKHASGFVAYEGDKPVWTATAIINEGCLFLFLVAIPPDARRRGYEQAVVRHALQTPIRPPASDGPCCMPQKPDTHSIFVLDASDGEVHGMQAGILNATRGEHVLERRTGGARLGVSA